jgi:hypothetical protein
MKKYLLPILMLVILIQAFFLTQKPEIITETTVVTDTTFVERTKTEYRKGEDITVVIEVPTFIPVDVDTTAILKDYLSKVIYKDTLFLPDSLGTVLLIDTIHKNRILDRTFTANVKEKTITTTITNNIFLAPTYHVFSGLEAAPNRIGVNFYIQDKKNRLYKIGLPLTGEGIEIGFAVRLR